MQPIFLASDLDRTILPNGESPESPQARERFHQLAQQSFLTLAYVSGRTRSLLEAAIRDYDLPQPDYAIGDVGTTVYEVGTASNWKPLEAWQEMIAPDWRGYSWQEMRDLFTDREEIWLQDDDPAFQNTFKLSYYTKPVIERDQLIERLKKITEALGIKAAFIWSVDEERDVGLLDVLPESATKLQAVQFLQKYLKFSRDRTVFAGDSGNDLPALTSSYQAILVKNAPEEIKQEAKEIVRRKQIAETLYVAEGGFLGMNGNYSAGVLEGVSYYFPEVKEAIT